MMRVRLTVVAIEKTIIITYSGHLSVALGTQHTKRMRRIILSSAASLVLPYFYTLSHKWYDFRGKKIYRTQSVF